MNYREFVIKYAQKVREAVDRVNAIMDIHGLEDCWVLRIPMNRQHDFSKWLLANENQGVVETFGFSRTMVVVGNDDDALHLRLAFEARNI